MLKEKALLSAQTCANAEFCCGESLGAELSALDRWALPHLRVCVFFLMRVGVRGLSASLLQSLAALVRFSNIAG